MKMRWSFAAIVAFAAAGCRFAIALPPPPPDLKVAIENCESRGEMCEDVLFQLQNSDPAKGERYAARGCRAHHVQACAALGQHYAEAGKLVEAWPFLAAACFANNHASCAELRERTLSLPPVLSPEPDHEPDAGDDDAILDAALMDAQQFFRDCYDLRRETQGELEFAATFSKGRPAVRVLRSTMNSDFTTCIVSRLSALSVPALTAGSHERTLQYMHEDTTGLPDGLDHMFQREYKFNQNAAVLEPAERERVVELASELARADYCVRAVWVRGVASNGSEDERATLGRARAAYVARVLEAAGRPVTSVALGYEATFSGPVDSSESDADGVVVQVTGSDDRSNCTQTR